MPSHSKVKPPFFTVADLTELSFDWPEDALFTILGVPVSAARYSETSGTVELFTVEPLRAPGGAKRKP